MDESKYSFINKTKTASPLFGFKQKPTISINLKRKPARDYFEEPVAKIFKTDVTAKESTSKNISTTTSTNASTCTSTITSGQTNVNTNVNNKNFKKIDLEEQRKNLPVYECRERLLCEFRKSDTLVIMSETGSGKTTQIPQFLLADNICKRGAIAVTQPRRVAAITVAKRVAAEQGCNLGDKVGYKIRFEDCTSTNTRIKFVTDGVLLREALKDRLLLQYTVIVLDEAHERSVNTDILFGIVKLAQSQRKQRGYDRLKIIITSATMDIDSFTKYFGVKALYLEGRSHPIRVFHAKEKQSDYIESALITLFDIHRNTPLNEDVLMFLTGQEEIEAMAQQIRQIVKSHNELPNVRVYPLYSQLPQSKQLDCFLPTPATTRKIILATNIAETSITIPGIRIIIDSGYVKRKINNAKNGIDMLKLTRISQAECWQRCGRAGRDAPGRCYRLYTKEEMESFPELVEPEILRCNLSNIILNLLAMSIDIKSFNFLDRPSSDSIKAAYSKLVALSAITNESRPLLTKIGNQMSKFPLDPRYSKLILTAPSFGCMKEIINLVAVLSSENIFITNTEKREIAAVAHAKFYSKHGDLITMLNVFTSFLTTEKAKLWCHDNYLNLRNLTYARDVRDQLLEVCDRLELPMNSCGINHEAVRKCIITGLFDNIAELQRDNTYLTLSNRVKGRIHPSSVFHGRYKPEYLIFVEMIQTEHNFLRQVVEISPKWISEVVPTFVQTHRIKLKS